jgi:hypothetical protein
MNKSSSTNKLIVILASIVAIAIVASIAVLTVVVAGAVKEKVALEKEQQAQTVRPPSITAEVDTSKVEVPTSESVGLDSSSSSTSEYQETTTTSIETSVSVLDEAIVVSWSKGNYIDEYCLVTFQGKTEFCVETTNGAKYDEDDTALEGNIGLFLRGDGCSTMESCFSLMTDPVDCSIFYTNLMWVADELVHYPAYNNGDPNVPPDIPINFWDTGGQNLQVHISENCSVTTEQL